MERLPLDLMPGSNSDWKRQRRGDRVTLENIQTDPITGVTTTWSKDLKHFQEIRRDELLNSSLRRHVSRSAEPGKVPEEPVYIIADNENNLIRSVELRFNTVSRSYVVELQVADNTVQNQFFVKYNGSNLYQIINSHYSLDLGTAFEIQLEKTLPENLQEFAQLCRIKGAEVAFNPYMGPVHGELNVNQKQYLDWAKDEPARMEAETMRAWSEVEKMKAKIDVTRLVGVVAAGLLENYYSQEEIHTICNGLINGVLGDLPFDFNGKEDFDERMEEIYKLLIRYVAMEVASNKQINESLGDFSTNFYFNQDSINSVYVTVEDFEDNIITQGYLKFGERYCYQEYDYGIYKDDQDRVVVTVEYPLQSKLKLQISVPQKIDFEVFASFIKTPETSGWEKALEVTDIKYNKYI